MNRADDRLLRAARAGDKTAEEQLLTENAPLIWSIVRRFYGRGVDPDDLYQLGCLGFVKAVRGFDPDFGTRFSTYAVPKISGEIRRFLRDDGPVKVSRGLKEQARDIRMARDRLEQQLGREPRLSELCAETGLEPGEIAMAEGAGAVTDSLQRETGEGGLTLEGLLCDLTQEEKMLDRLSLREAIDRLPEKERSVILLRYFRDLTQDRTARILQVSQVQISRLEKRAIGLLRNELT